MDFKTATTDKIKKCMEECDICAQTCCECFETCVTKPDFNDRRACVKMLVECASMCDMTSAFMSADNPSTRGYCQKCADVCHECALECVKFKDKDKDILKCAIECQVCAERCNDIVNTLSE